MNKSLKSIINNFNLNNMKVWQNFNYFHLIAAKSLITESKSIVFTVYISIDNTCVSQFWPIIDRLYVLINLSLGTFTRCSTTRQR